MHPMHRNRVTCTACMLAGTLILGLVGCSPRETKSDTHVSPAKVEKLPQETEIARITLAEQAEQRLGIALAEVIRQNVEQRRTFGGELTIPAGKSIIVSAPVAGTIDAPDQATIPLPGEAISAGDAVMKLVPLLSPERYVPTPAERLQMANTRATLLSDLTIAAGDVQRSQAELEAAQITLERAEKLLADKAGSARAVDDARAVSNLADTNLTAAKLRESQIKQLIAELDANGASGQPSPMLLTAPQVGVVRNVSVTRGQTVTVGAALFEVVDVTSLWIRVPIYVGLLDQVDQDAPAQVVGLDGRTAPKPRVARPVAAPPTADPLSTTADLYFEVDNAAGDLRPGQRIGVELIMVGAADGLIVPAKAIVYDIYGGTWVYAALGHHTFERRRVLVRFTMADRVVLEQGPPVGTQVVIDGVAELYGTEFGAGK